MNNQQNKLSTPLKKPFFLRFIITVFSIFLLSACHDKEEKPIVSKANATISDPQLASCINQAGIADLEAIKNLNCTNFSITDIRGISLLTNLETINFSNNQITDLGPIVFLYKQQKRENSATTLTFIDLSNNRIFSSEKLSELDEHIIVRLNGNPLQELVAPSYILATQSDQQTSIRWSNVAGALSYQLQFRVSGDETAEFEVIKDLSTTRYIHENLENGVSYEYQVNAVYPQGLGLLSALVTATPREANSLSDAPIFQYIRAQEDNILIDWKDIDDAKTYHLYITTGGEIDITTAEKIENVIPPYSHRPVTANTTYTYILAAENILGESQSESASVATPAVKEKPPTETLSVKTDDTNPVAGTFTISWVTPEGASNIRLFYGTSAELSESNGLELANPQSPFTHPGLSNQFTHYYLLAYDTADGEHIELRASAEQKITITELVIADPGLQKCLENSGYVFAQDVTSLRCEGYNIQSLIGIEQFSALIKLELPHNQITDLSPLSTLTSLIELNLLDNNIRDLEALKSLIALQTLQLQKNQLTQIDALTVLIEMRQLGLNDNQIINLEPLTALAKLERLQLANNVIIDLSHLTSLENLSHLDLSQNQILEINELGNLNQLIYLDLNHNYIQNFEPVTSLALLQYLNQEANEPPPNDDPIIVNKPVIEFINSLDNNLLAYYPFNGNANDESNSENHGAALNVTPVSDRNGNTDAAYLFNGEDSYIETSIERSDYTQFSMCAWFKYDGQVSDGYQTLFSGNTTDFWVGKDQNNSNIGIQENQYNANVAIGTNAWDGEWHNLCYVYDSGLGTLYLDSNNVGSASLGLGNGPLWIGKENEGSGYIFNGIIDDVRIYGRSLVQTEVSEIFSGNAPIRNSSDENVLCVSAIDVEDGELDSDSIVWQSDIDGDIGSGKCITTKLTSGDHVISVNATDNDGNSTILNKNVQINEYVSPDIISRFDNGSLDDWEVTLAGVTNPGDGMCGSFQGSPGYLCAAPGGEGNTSYYIAPPLFIGNLSHFKTLGFDLWANGGSYFESGHGSFGDVIIRNGDKSATFIFDISSRPSNDWKSYTIPLDSGSWILEGAATLDEILINVTALNIRAEYGVGTDYSGIDNVFLTEETTFPDPVLESIQLNSPSLTFEVGQTQQLIVEATYSDSSTSDITSVENIDWNSSNDEILSINVNGLITANLPGTSEITVNTLGKEAKITIAVVDAIVDTDGDGLSDTDEANTYSTDPAKFDSDDDGFYDAHEIAAGSDPNDSAIFPEGTIIDSDIFSDSDNVTWSLANAPYLLSATINISTDKTLTIEAGVVIKAYDNRSISVVGGKLNIFGNSSQPQYVVFTSIADDSINGDSTLNGNGTNPRPGRWRGIDLFGGVGSIQHTEIRYAATGFSITNSDAILDNITIQQSSSYGLLIQNSSPLLSNVTINNPESRGIYIWNVGEDTISSPAFSGVNTITRSNNNYPAIEIYGPGANPNIIGFTINGGNYGLHFDQGAQGSYADIQLNNNSLAAVYMSNNSTPLEFNNIFVDNTPTPIILNNQVLPTSIDLVAGLVIGQNTSMKYLTVGGSLTEGNYALSPDPLNNGESVWLTNYLSVSTNATLNIEEDTILKLNGGLTINSDSSILNINGTETKPVLFTSFRDDSIGGDSNGDGDSTTAQTGNWSGVSYTNGGAGSVKYAKIYYAGIGLSFTNSSDLVTVDNVFISQPTNFNYSIYIQNSSPTLSNLSIDNSGNYGIYIYNTNASATTAPIFTGVNSISGVGNGYSGIYVYGAGANPDISGFSIDGGNYSLNLDQGAQGSYTNLQLNNATSAAMRLANDSAPAVFSNITVNNTPTPLNLENQVLPTSIDLVDGFLSVQSTSMKYVQISGTLRDGEYTLSPDPLNNGESVWFVTGLAASTNATLNIDAGTVLKLNGALSANSGTLNINGTAANPIIMTSIYDDAIGGDTNGDGDATTAQTGNWTGISFSNGAGSIQYADINYAGTGLSFTNSSDSVTVDNISIDQPNNYSYSIYIQNSSPTFSNLSILNSGSYGIYIYNTRSGAESTPTFTGINTISGVSSSYSAIYVYGVGANPNISGFIIDGGNYSLNLDQGAQGSYTDLQLNNATLGAVRLANNSDPSDFNNITVSNTPTPLILDGQILPSSIDLVSGFVTDQTTSIKYLQIGGNFTNGEYTLSPDPLNNGESVWFVTGLTVSTNATLNVAAGTILKLKNGALSANSGTLNINGTETNPVRLTSFNDDAIGGDSNGDGTDSAAQTGNWTGVSFSNGSGSIQYAEIYYAGTGISISNSDEVNVDNVIIEQPTNYSYSIYIQNSSPTLSNLSIINAGYYGIYIYNTRANIAATPTFTGINNITGVVSSYPSIYVYGSGANPNLSGFIIDGGQYGLQLNQNAAGTYANNTFRFAGQAGIHVNTNSTPIIENNIIIGNGDNVTNPRYDGGGIFVQKSGIGTIIQHNIIRQNIARNGGGVYLSDNANVNLQNNLIVENKVSTSAAGIYIKSGATANILGNTISENYTLAEANTGGVHIEVDATVTAIDNIISGNTFNSGADVSNLGQLTENNNLTSDGSLTGAGDITGDPLFIDGWYLSSANTGQEIDSPAIDAGSEVVPAYLLNLETATTNIDGIVDGSSTDPVDMGFHYQINAPFIDPVNTIITVSAATIVTGDEVIITVDPKNDFDEILGAGLIVDAFLFDPSQGTISEFFDLADGSYEAIFTSNENFGPQQIDIFVNGIQLPSVDIAIVTGGLP